MKEEEDKLACTDCKKFKSMKKYKCKNRNTKIQIPKKIQKIQMQKYKCKNRNVKLQMLKYQCKNTNAKIQMQKYKCKNTNAKIHMQKYKCKNINANIQKYHNTKSWKGGGGWRIGLRWLWRRYLFHVGGIIESGWRRENNKPSKKWWWRYQKYRIQKLQVKM